MTEFSPKLPVWYQLAMKLRAEILSGARSPGSRLEAEVPWAARLGVSVMPVRRALRSLEAEGLISRQRGRGTFVSERDAIEPGATSLEALYSREFQTEADVIARGIGPVPPEFAGAFAPRLELAFLTRLTFRGAAPWSFGTLYFLPEFDAAITTPLLHRYPLYRIMAEQCGVELQRSQFTTRAVAAPAEVAAQLGVDPFSPVLHLTAISYDIDDRPVGAFDMHFLSDVHAFAFETLHGQGN